MSKCHFGFDHRVYCLIWLISLRHRNIHTRTMAAQALHKWKRIRFCLINENVLCAESDVHYSTIGFDYSIHKIYHIHYFGLIHTYTMMYAYRWDVNVPALRFNNSKSHVKPYVQCTSIFICEICPQIRASSSVHHQIYFTACSPR